MAHSDNLAKVEVVGVAAPPQPLKASPLSAASSFFLYSLAVLLVLATLSGLLAFSLHH